jgi:rhomboid protease GluP
MNCASCGSGNFNWARTCNHCGAPLSAPTPDDQSVPPPAQSPLALNESAEPVAVLDPDAERRAAFLHALATTTPHVFVTPVLIAVNVAVFVAMAARGVSVMNPTTDDLLSWGATYAPALTRGEWWRLLTSVFVHAGLLHLAFNMLVLRGIGGLTERLFGNAGFLILYVLAGLGGSLAGVYWHPVTPAVGASGALFGVYGGVVGFLVRQRSSIPPDALRSLGRGAVGFVVLNTLISLTLPNIDMAGHVGGLVTGALAGYALARPLGPSRWSVRLAANGAVAAVGLAAVVAIAARVPAIDDLLAGLNALATLERQSTQTLNEGLGKVQSSQMSDADFVSLIETQVLPPWQQRRATLSAFRLPAREREIVARLVSYMDLRADAWRLMAAAFRTGDLTLMRESREKHREAEGVAAALASRTGVKKPAVSMPDAADRELDEAILLQQTMAGVQKLEASLKATFNEHLASMKANRISPTQFADVVERQVLLPWTREYERLNTMRTPPALQPEITRVTTYMSLQAEAWTLLVRGLKTNSATLLEAASRKTAEAAAFARQGREAPADTSAKK